MQHAKLKMESTENGFTLESQGNVLTMGVMIGRTIASIMAQLPAPVAMAFRAAVVMGYDERKRGDDRGETESIAGDS